MLSAFLQVMKEKCQSQKMAALAMTQIRILGTSNTMLFQTAFPSPRFLMKKGVLSPLSPQQSLSPWAWAHPPQEQKILLISSAQSLRLSLR